MSDESYPESPISTWTFETLVYHLKSELDGRRAEMMAIMEERDRRLEERWQTQKEDITRLAAAYIADKAAANEWRGALENGRATYLPRKEWEQGHHTLSERYAMLNDRLLRIESRQGYLSASVLLSVLSLLVAIAVGLIGFFHLYTGR